MSLKLPVEYVQKMYADVSNALLEKIAPSHVHEPWYESASFEQVISVLSAVQLALFVPLAWWVHKHPVDPEDLKITDDMQRDRSALLINAARVLSYLSTPKYLRVAVVPLGSLFWIKGLRLEAVITIGMNWTGEAVKATVKRLVNRPRPSPALVHVWKSRHHQSFPSGNVIAASTLWGWLFFLGLVYWRDKPAWQKALLGIPLLFMVLVGPSRVYLGDHWTTDVVGGYLLGNSWLGLWLRLYLLLLSRRGAIHSARWGRVTG